MHTLSPKPWPRLGRAVLLALCLVLAQSCGRTVEPYVPTPVEADLSFANQGLFTLGADAVLPDASAAFVTTDAAGNVWAAGAYITTGNAVFVRLHADGALDPTFGSSGYFVDPPEVPPIGFDGRSGIAVVPFAGGGAFVLESTMFIKCFVPSQCSVSVGAARRIDASGTIDKSYGDAGVAFARFFGRVEQGIADSRGGIVFIARLYGGPSTAALFRIGGNGQVDAEFATRAGDALGCPDLPAFSGGVPRIALQPDGKLLVAQIFGYGNENGVNSVCLCRLNPDGTSDATYGGTGRVQLADPLIALGTVNVLDVFGAGDGSATLVLNKQTGDYPMFSYSFIVIALTPQGTMDTTRYNRGYAGQSDSLIARAVAVAVQADGEVVVAGYPGIGTAPSWQGQDSAQPRLERIGLNGQSDPTFGPGGQGFQSLALSGHLLDAMHIHVADKSIFVSGTAQRHDAAAVPGRKYFAIAKFVGG